MSQFNCYKWNAGIILNFSLIFTETSLN